LYAVTQADRGSLVSSAVTVPLRDASPTGREYWSVVSTVAGAWTTLAVSKLAAPPLHWGR
jgi:hypothetical protein